MIGGIIEAVSESLQDTRGASTLINELPSLQENAIEAATDTRNALESAVSGLAWYVPKVSGAAQEGRLAAEADRSARYILDNTSAGDPLLRKAEEHTKDAALYSGIATENRNWALEAGSKVLPDLQIALGGLSTFKSKAEQILPLIGTSLTAGIRRHLERATVPLAGLETDGRDLVQVYKNNLGAGITDSMFLAGCFKTALEQVETEYSIEDLSDRLSEALGALEASQDKNIKGFAECLEMATQKVTEEDLETLKALLKNLKWGMKKMREGVDHREDLQKHTREAIEGAETLLGQL